MANLPRGHIYHPVAVSDNASAHFGDLFIQIGSRKRPRDDDNEFEGTKKQVTDIHDNDPAILLIRSLQFDGIWQRHENIATEYPGTCSWSLAPDNGQEAQGRDGLPRHQSLQTDFTNWLTSDQDFYWVCGTAGAGKSTLLSFMVNHQDQVKQRLAKWAGDRQLVVASFFFWKYGSFMQKSICGMLRSLIIQTIMQIPALVSKLQKSSLLGDQFNTTLSFDQPWTRTKLETLLRAAIDASNANFCIFIDALDEFHGYYSETGLSPHELALRETTRDLLATIQEIKILPAVKVCVASRPGNVFDYAFSDRPHLDLQHINNDDIKKFVHGELGQTFPVQVAEHFCRRITARSQGIFLWAKLVVNTLIEAYEDGDGEDVVKLEKRLDELPLGLDDIYRSMLSRVNPRFKDDSHVLFNLVAYLNEETYKFVHVNALFVLFSRACHILTPSEPTEKLQALSLSRKWLQKMVQSRGCGLLEVQTLKLRLLQDEDNNGAGWTGTESDLFRLTRSRIDFIHRTAQEFVKNCPHLGRQSLEQKVRHIVDGKLPANSNDRKCMTFAAGLEQSVIKGGLMLLKAAASWHDSEQNKPAQDTIGLFHLERLTYFASLRHILRAAADRYGSQLFATLDEYGLRDHSQHLAEIVRDDLYFISRSQLGNQLRYNHTLAFHIHACHESGLTDYAFNRIGQSRWIDDHDIPLLLELYMLDYRPQRRLDLRWFNLLFKKLANITEHTTLIASAMKRFMELLWEFHVYHNHDYAADSSLIDTIRKIFDQCPQIVDMKIYVEQFKRSSQVGWTTVWTSPAVILRMWLSSVIDGMRVQHWTTDWPAFFRIERLNLLELDLEIPVDEDQSAFILEDMINAEPPYINLGTQQQNIRRDWIILYTIARHTDVLSQEITWRSFLDRSISSLSAPKYSCISRSHERELQPPQAAVKFLECESFGLRPCFLQCHNHWESRFFYQMCSGKRRAYHSQLKSIFSKDEWTRIDEFDRFMEEKYPMWTKMDSEDIDQSNLSETDCVDKAHV